MFLTQQKGLGCDPRASSAAKPVAPSLPGCNRKLSCRASSFPSTRSPLLHSQQPSGPALVGSSSPNAVRPGRPQLLKPGHKGVVVSVSSAPTMDLTMDRVPSRSQQLDRLAASSKEDPFDVLIIGGGSSGAGCAVDAQTRNLRIAMSVRASGTKFFKSPLQASSAKEAEHTGYRADHLAIHQHIIIQI